MWRVLMPVLAVALLATSAPALAVPEGVNVAIRPGGFVEVSVVDRESVRAVELVAPDGGSFRPIQTSREAVIARYGPGGPTYEPASNYYNYHPWYGFYNEADPFCGDSLGFNSLLPSLGCYRSFSWPPPGAHVRNVARFLIGNTRFFQETWTQWRLRIAYSDGRLAEYGVPAVEYRTSGTL
jgi:hypothetical protein